MSGKDYTATVINQIFISLTRNTKVNIIDILTDSSIEMVRVICRKLQLVSVDRFNFRCSAYKCILLEYTRYSARPFNIEEPIHFTVGRKAMVSINLLFSYSLCLWWCISKQENNCGSYACQMSYETTKDGRKVFQFDNIRCLLISSVLRVLTGGCVPSSTHGSAETNVTSEFLSGYRVINLDVPLEMVFSFKLRKTGK